MSQTYQIPDAAVSETPLTAGLSAAHTNTFQLKMHCGAQTPLRFSGADAELDALLHSAGVFDLGYRTFLRATGKDRVRWLNGMITQAVKSMVPGQVGYTLVLNPQGRIQGDGDVLCYEEFLQLETDRSQSERLLAHLRRFIIMDDVQLNALDAGMTAIGMAGPQAPAILKNLGGAVPEDGAFQSTTLGAVDVTVVRAYGPVVPRFVLYVAAEQVLALWNAVTAAGATPSGIETMEAFRLLEGVPLFDVDFGDKHLPQEANLYRALNFTKGCYIGQEIVERIRSRATVHRALRQFELQGEAPQLVPGEKIELRSGETVAGEITSVARFTLPGFSKTLALGVARIEALERSEAGNEPIRYNAGTAAPLATPPVPANL